jgi:hypothetical protein
VYKKLSKKNKQKYYETSLCVQSVLKGINQLIWVMQKKMKLSEVSYRLKSKMKHDVSVHGSINAEKRKTPKISRSLKSS